MADQKVKYFENQYKTTLGKVETGGLPDDADHAMHEDTLDEKGNIVRKTWFEFLDNKQALDLAVKDLKDNHEIYSERFMKWLKK